MNTENMTNEQLQEIVKQQQVEMERLRKERNMAMNKQTDAEAMISEIMNLGLEEAQELLDMEYNFSGATERAVRVAKERGTNIDFDCFVKATKDLAIEDVEGDITEDQRMVLDSVIIDSGSVSWGAVVEYGDSTVVLSEQAQRLFAKYVRNGNEDDKVAFIEQAKLEQ